MGSTVTELLALISIGCVAFVRTRQNSVRIAILLLLGVFVFMRDEVVDMHGVE